MSTSSLAMATQAPLFDYAVHERNLASESNAYRNAPVFPHIAFDNFIDPQAIRQAVNDFPPIRDEGWIHYVHVNEKKGGLNKRDLLPASILSIIDEFNSPRFTAWLSQLTGIPGLVPDPDLEGGGIHQIERGGFLNIHADFTAHPHKRMWRRRVNVLLYLNDNWQEEFGGHLELWEKDMSKAFKRVLPVLNRCVIFNTDFDSYHGHPHALTCPDGVTRKSIALYYFTEESEAPRKAATNYKARPEDGAVKSMLIYADKKLLSVYNWLKGALNINDDAMSKLLRYFRPRR